MDSEERDPVVYGDGVTEFTENFSEMAEILFSAGSVPDTLARVVELAVATIEGCDYAGLSIVEGSTVSTPAATDPIVERADALQHEAGEGPSLDAVAHRQIFYANDLETDERWRQFAPLATSLGIRSMLTLPLSPAPSPGAVNLYARYPDAFGVVDRAKAAILSSLASLALEVAHTHEDEERRFENLRTALDTREVIGEALGILMERERITSNQAFSILRQASQHLNLKLREVAQNLVDTGERPDTGVPYDEKRSQ
jgi:hypothetical protein